MRDDPPMKRLAVCDSETDPFLVGRIPAPFVWGIYHDGQFHHFWGDDCDSKFLAYVETMPEDYVIYAHNGGRFDFMFLIPHATGDIKIINGRIAKMMIGKHEFRDSFSILPVALAAYAKDDFDYNKMEKTVRERYKNEIITYLKSDCLNLYHFVEDFRTELGDGLTIAGTAMKELKKFHAFQQTSKAFDATLRPYYFGGRVECFKTGHISMPMQVLDVVSMYPTMMRDIKHPVGNRARISRRIGPHTFFAKIIADSDGALPVRNPDDGSLDFPHVKNGEFFATIHEINAGIETGTLRIHKVKHARDFEPSATFTEFVDHFHSQRLKAKANNDKARTLFYKLVLNSAYGKFAQNPANYHDWQITPSSAEPLKDGWSPSYISQFGYIIWKKPATMFQYHNVATAASITGAARATLLRGLAQAREPIYCDTDSIICRNFDGAIGPNLGDWSLEASGSDAYIAGKKLYAIYNGSDAVKYASKGAKLTPAEIRSIALGGSVEYHNPVPAFKLDGNHKWTVRTMRQTS